MSTLEMDWLRIGLRKVNFDFRQKKLKENFLEKITTVFLWNSFSRYATTRKWKEVSVLFKGRHRTIFAYDHRMRSDYETTNDDMNRVV